MATTTPNFGWSVPTSTDLVKDGATAIETLGDSIDASLVDLKGGTTGQVLAKNSNTDMDFTWSAIDPLVILDAKGDLITATAADTPARLAVGTNGQVLTADSTAATGLKWAAGSASGMTLVARTSFSNVASQAFDNVFSTSYFSYLVIIEQIYAATNSDDLQMQMRYGSTTITSSQYNGNLISTDRASTTITNTAQSGTAQFTIGLVSGDGAESSAYQMTFTKVGNTSTEPLWLGTGATGGNYYGLATFGGSVHNSQTYTGFLLKSSSSNITGIVSVYGLAKA